MASPLSSFNEVLRERLKEVGLTLPQGPAQPVYSLNFTGKAAMHFIDAGNQSVDLVAEAGTLQNLRSAETLLALLGCTPSVLPHCIALHCDKQNGALLLWTRLTLAQLDRQAFDSLVASMLARIDAVSEVLSGRTGSARKPPSTGHWMRLTQVDARASAPSPSPARATSQPAKLNGSKPDA